MGNRADVDSGPKLLTEAQLRTMLKGKSREVQVGPCLRPRYTGWGKCCQCVGKVAGDSCRFREFRIFEWAPYASLMVYQADGRVAVSIQTRPISSILLILRIPSSRRI